MNDFRPLPAPPAPKTEARRLRRRALWAGLLLPPATVVVVVLALSTETGTECVMRGTCTDIPGGLYLGTLAVAAAAWIWALATPDTRPPAPPAPPAVSRRAALWTLLGAEAFFLTLVLGHFLPGRDA
ncbi:hypothetical protein ACFY8W_29665 [Streptomyces sp. NPDC012637]|uniref:hypothetical protein n=1 Tax=Streptomyces sp. NPDC012637 TaxID=3364842 RepID=UPI0036E040E8